MIIVIVIIINYPLPRRTEHEHEPTTNVYDRSLITRFSCTPLIGESALNEPQRVHLRYYYTDATIALGCLEVFINIHFFSFLE